MLSDLYKEYLSTQADKGTVQDIEGQKISNGKDQKMRNLSMVSIACQKMD
jgi:hypothetical protein